MHHKNVILQLLITYVAILSNMIPLPSKEIGKQIVALYTQKGNTARDFKIISYYIVFIKILIVLFKYFIPSFFFSLLLSLFDIIILLLQWEY